MAPGARYFHHIPYSTPVLDRHVFSPERSLSPPPDRESRSPIPPQEKCLAPGELNYLGTTSKGHVNQNVMRDDDIILMLPSGTSDIGSDSEDMSSVTLTPPPSLCDNMSEDAVPKPKGPLGKPSGGGYSLPAALAWSTKDYKEAQEYLHGLARERLDISKSFSSQDPDTIEQLCRMADERFPILKRYVDRWATKDFFATFLKNSSQKARSSRVAGNLQGSSKGPIHGKKSAVKKQTRVMFVDSQP